MPVLRRFHKRKTSQSNPTSPAPDQVSFDTTIDPEDGASTLDPRPRTSTSVPFAQSHGQTTSHTQTQWDVIPPGFLGGLTLNNYRRDQTTWNQPQTTASSAPLPTPSNNKSPPPMKPVVVQTASSFVSPTDLLNVVPGGKPPIAQEPSKAKKGLPFLKNLDTFKLRKKTNRIVPVRPLPLRDLPENERLCDPRIIGTVVHDFDVPRPRNTVVQSSKEPVHSYSAERQVSEAPPVPPKDDHAVATAAASRTSSSRSESLALGATPSQKTRDSSTLQNEGQEVEKNNQQSRSSLALSRISMSRHASGASVKSSFSAIPRHMKSTSSRFSFDMIGPAKQEKLLEDRHRQQQQDKTAHVPTDRPDSRFDEFDEDAFDYDAMDYDDDLEERIPGVNADDDELEDFEAANDPDNDQDNFAGFAFQRSGPTSSLTSPYPTPRDENGHDTGYTKTGGTLDHSAQHDLDKLDDEDSPAGLGRQELDHSSESSTVGNQKKVELGKDDELYFDDGLLDDFRGEGDGSTFDESIFDLEDTDKYGRPLAGVFADALAERNEALETKKRESDVTSRLSGHSVVSPSTAHTSLTVDMRYKLLDRQGEIDNFPVGQPEALPQTTMGVESDTVAAYQAALAAAAHKAAASGKFHRGSSPTDLRLTPVSSHEDAVNETLDEYEYDDGFSAGLDDYELEDDAIIAEANAIALANDFDGWYGQEFGFYSAPVTQPNHAPNSLSENNLSQYSNGGFFGPSGIIRSTSGRVVSREPSLTPITERSEYSNRNSLMSVGWPQRPNSAGAIQSPGLAQLAMMADDHDMSLSSLLKLRNKTFGGSQTSLTSSREGSSYDRNGNASLLGQEFGSLGVASGRKNSTFSIYSRDSAAPGSDTGSPTLMMAMPNVATNSIPSLALSSSPKPSSTISPITAPIFSPLTGAMAFPPLSEAEESNPHETLGKSC